MRLDNCIIAFNFSLVCYPQFIVAVLRYSIYQFYFFSSFLVCFFISLWINLIIWCMVMDLLSSYITSWLNYLLINCSLYIKYRNVQRDDTILVLQNANSVNGYMDIMEIYNSLGVAVSSYFPIYNVMWFRKISYTTTLQIYITFVSSYVKNYFRSRIAL